MPSENPVIELRHVFVERQHKRVLIDINWVVRPGEQWAVMGLNGSGKTSLLSLIPGYLWPTSGSVSVLGLTLGRIDVRDLRTRIAWVSQQMTEWLTRDHGQVSVHDLVAAGARAEVGRPRSIGDPAAIDWALEQFDLTAIRRQAFGVLSSGEKTRVLLARAWTSQAALVLLDEPCAGLDLNRREALLGQVSALLHHHIPLVYVTHHPEEIPSGVSHLLLIKEGRVLQQGRIDEVLTGPHLSQAFDVPVVVHRSGGRHWVEVVPLDAFKSGRPLSPPTTHPLSRTRCDHG